jgi:hypothetical protein
MSKLVKKIIGHVPVESACLMVIDPCMLRDVLFCDNKNVDEWYEKNVCEELDVTECGDWAVKDESKNSDIGRIVIAGVGDVSYPIEATYLPDGSIKEIRIIFQ